MSKTVIKVDGMSCEHCVKAVSGAAGGVAGVTSVAVDLDSGDVTLEYDGSDATLSKVKAEIEEQGYDIVA
jgi:copper chaperone